MVQFRTGNRSGKNKSEMQEAENKLLTEQVMAKLIKSINFVSNHQKL